MNLFKIAITSLIFFFSTLLLQAQVTTDPVCFADNESVKIIYDASKGTSGLVGADKVYMHAGVVTTSQTGTSWSNVIGNWGADDGIGQMTKVSGTSDQWEITLTPRTYFDVPSSETIYRLGMVFRNADGSKEGKNDSNGDIFINLATDAVNLQLTSENPLLVDNGDIVPVSATTCSNATFNLYVNDALETTVSGTNTFDYDYQITQVAGESVQIRLTATVGSDTNEQSFSFSVRTPSENVPRPAGIVDGINYDTDLTKVTLSVWAPFKSSVHLVGDFNNWEINPDYQMKKDGEHFWLEVTGLTPGQEYAYQYLVDESIWIADPYADKILDPDDKWIPESTYPNLKAYPEGAVHANWYENRTAVLQTNQNPYLWNDATFIKPNKEDLVIYQLLVRDFLGEDNMNYQALIDTLGYFKDLGVNTIQFLPIMEFGGNDSWGYNPTFMFAVDKAYGTKNDLKEFIDTAHGMGFAVILDMVMNQNDIPSPYAQMYFDFNAFKPTSQNPWFNVEATHPFNVFFDINHESTYTKTWLDSVNRYWINEYHFDGYRFDLSKGFTQKNANGDVGKWGQKDDSRIAILERMADKIWENDPSTYVILEHFADNSEEKILSDYGMMFWGNSSFDYSEISMGYAASKSIDWIYYKSRNWNNNHVIGYMESHDEERQMFKNQEYGNSSGSYNVKDINTALKRSEAAATFFFTVPGPKLFWQFGELGYDVPIDFNGRTGRKPTKWEYLEDPNHQHLRSVYKELIGLRSKYDVFTKGEFSWQPDGNLKSIHTSNADTSIVILGNFGMERVEIPDPAFQHTGTWYDFFTGGEITIDDVNAPLSFGAGEYRIYTDVKLHTPELPIITNVKDVELAALNVYPNPVINQLNVDVTVATAVGEWSILDLSGRTILSGDADMIRRGIDVQLLNRGLYHIRIRVEGYFQTYKFIKQ